MPALPEAAATLPMLEQVLNAITSRQRFLLTSHARPDGDAIGSLLALRSLLLQLGKQAEIVMYDPVPRVYRNLPGAGAIVQVPQVAAPTAGTADTTDYDAAVLLECDSTQRTHLGGLDRYLLINIDHHQSGRAFAQVNWIDPHASSTAELIFRLVHAAGAKLTPEMATCLYAAVLTDTGSFTYIGTSANTFSLARELTLAGAEPATIARGIYFSHSDAKIRLLGAALSTLRIQDGVAWMHVTHQQMEQFGALEEDCEGLVNYALSIEKVQVAVFFREIGGNRFRVSLRSKGNLNVAAVAGRFGGGGHECASGCSVNGNIETAAAQVLQQLRQQLAAQHPKQYPTQYP